MKIVKNLELSDILVANPEEWGSFVSFVPSIIKGIADATHNNSGSCHNSLPKISNDTYDAVTYVNIYVEGISGGGSCPTISKDDFEQLTKRTLGEKVGGRDLSEMIGESLTVVYSNGSFAGFIPNYLE